MVSDWNASAIESLVESASTWKKKTMNSELKKLKLLETKVRKLIPEESQDKIIQPMKNDASMENDVSTANDNRAKYGSEDFEMPRFSRVTEEDLKELVKQQNKTEETEQDKTEETIKSSKIRAEGKKFEEYYRQVSKLQGLEKGYKAEEFRHQIKNSLLIAEIGKLEKQVEYMQGRKDKTIENEQENVKIAREAFWDKRIENAKSMIEAKNDERNKIILAVEGKEGFRERLGKIKDEYLILQGEEVKKDKNNTVTNENLSEIQVDKSSINLEELNKNKIYAELMQKLADREKESIEKGSTGQKKQKDKEEVEASWTDGVTHEYTFLYKKVKEGAKKEKIDKKNDGKRSIKKLNLNIDLKLKSFKNSEKSRDISSKKLKKYQDKKLEMSQEEMEKRFNEIQNEKQKINNDRKQMKLDKEDLALSKEDYNEKEFRKEEIKLEKKELELEKKELELNKEEKELRKIYQEKFVDEYNSGPYDYNNNNFDLDNHYQSYEYSTENWNNYTDYNIPSGSRGRGRNNRYNKQFEYQQSEYDEDKDSVLNGYRKNKKLQPFPDYDSFNQTAFDNVLTPTSYDNTNSSEQQGDNNLIQTRDNRQSLTSNETNEINQEEIEQQTIKRDSQEVKQEIAINQEKDDNNIETAVNSNQVTEQIGTNKIEDEQETAVNSNQVTEQIGTNINKDILDQKINLNEVNQKIISQEEEK